MGLNRSNIEQNHFSWCTPVRDRRKHESVFAFLLMTVKREKGIILKHPYLKSITNEPQTN